MSVESGALYVVATPIGNLEDISARALHVLQAVNCIAAEDTRHTGQLLRHFGITTPLLSLHEHNEHERVTTIIARLRAGSSLALVSDAGTPLISDPGFPLVRALRQENIPVIPIPGPSSIITALSVAGLPTDRFIFEGFLPAKTQARCERLRTLATDARTLVFLEASHRIVESVQDMAQVFGSDRFAVIARELTKRFETVHGAPLRALVAWLTADVNQLRGEFVVLVHGAVIADAVDTAENRRLLSVLLAELPTSRAVVVAAQLTGLRKKPLYDLALRLSTTPEP